MKNPLRKSLLMRSRRRTRAVRLSTHLIRFLDLCSMNVIRPEAHNSILPVDLITQTRKKKKGNYRGVSTSYFWGQKVSLRDKYFYLNSSTER